MGRDTTSSARHASGRFVLRIPPALHATLRAAARTAGLSLNDYCARRLAAPAGSLVVTGPAPGVVAHAAAVAGESLLGLVAYGSWARGDATPESDLDLLVVLERGVRLTRALYRRWDETPPGWDGRTVDPHFVHLPDDDAPPSGVWAEAAIDGIVLFERDLRLSAALIRVRRAIAEGRLVRRLSHGQPYWAEAS